MKYLAQFGQLTFVASCLAIITYLAIYNKTSSSLKRPTAKERAIGAEWIAVSSLEGTVSATRYSNLSAIHSSVTSRSSASYQQSLVGSTAKSFHNLRARNVFYNRIGKCGSRSLFQVIHAIAHYNRIKVAFSTDYAHEHPPPSKARAEMVKIARLKPPTLYNRHIYFLDFEKSGFKSPIYINMVRDPIERFSSHYNYIKYGDVSGNVTKPRTDWKDINECVMDDMPQCRDEHMMFYMGFYFCGLEDTCKNYSKERVGLAKKHIDDDYYVIGTLEEFENTLHLLEKMLPNFFRGARKVWKRLQEGWQRKTKTARKDFLSEEAKKKLRIDNLADEYEVYEHAKKKFERLKKELGIS